MPANQFECQCSVYQIQLLVRLKSPTYNCAENISHKHNAWSISFFNIRPKKVSKCLWEKLRYSTICFYSPFEFLITLKSYSNTGKKWIMFFWLGRPTAWFPVTEFGYAPFQFTCKRNVSTTLFQHFLRYHRSKVKDRGHLLSSHISHYMCTEYISCDWLVGLVNAVMYILLWRNSPVQYFESDSSFHFYSTFKIDGTHFWCFKWQAEDGL